MADRLDVSERDTSLVIVSMVCFFPTLLFVIVWDISILIMPLFFHELHALYFLAVTTVGSLQVMRFIISGTFFCLRFYSESPQEDIIEI